MCTVAAPHSGDYKGLTYVGKKKKKKKTLLLTSSSFPSSPALSLKKGSSIPSPAKKFRQSFPRLKLGKVGRGVRRRRDGTVWEGEWGGGGGGGGGGSGGSEGVD